MKIEDIKQQITEQKIALENLAFRLQDLAPILEKLGECRAEIMGGKCWVLIWAYGNTEVAKEFARAYGGEWKRKSEDDRFDYEVNTADGGKIIILHAEYPTVEPLTL